MPLYISWENMIVTNRRDCFLLRLVTYGDHIADANSCQERYIPGVNSGKCCLWSVRHIWVSLIPKLSQLYVLLDCSVTFRKLLSATEMHILLSTVYIHKILIFLCFMYFLCSLMACDTSRFGNCR